MRTKVITTAKGFEEVINFHKDEVNWPTKLMIVDYAMSFEAWQNYTEEEKNKLIDYVYSYYIDSDSTEYTLWDLVEWTLGNDFLQGSSEKFKNMSYQDFENFIDNQTF